MMTSSIRIDTDPSDTGNAKLDYLRGRVAELEREVETQDSRIEGLLQAEADLQFVVKAQQLEITALQRRFGGAVHASLSASGSGGKRTYDYPRQPQKDLPPMPPSLPDSLSSSQSKAGMYSDAADGSRAQAQHDAAVARADILAATVTEQAEEIAALRVEVQRLHRVKECAFDSDRVHRCYGNNARTDAGVGPAARIETPRYEVEISGYGRKPRKRMGGQQESQPRVKVDRAERWRGIRRGNCAAPLPAVPSPSSSSSSLSSAALTCARARDVERCANKGSKNNGSSSSSSTTTSSAEELSSASTPGAACAWSAAAVDYSRCNPLRIDSRVPTTEIGDASTRESTRESKSKSKSSTGFKGKRQKEFAVRSAGGGFGDIARVRQWQ